MNAYRPKPPEEVRRNMSAIRSTGGKAEITLRSVLHRRGLRFRKHYRKLEGVPDIVFVRPRVAVFVDGDYWHARTLREKGPEALQAQFKTANRAYWIDKFTKRVVRDDYVTETLRAEGWTVLRFWETDVLADMEGTADIVEREVRQRRAKPYRPTKGADRVPS